MTRAEAEQKWKTFLNNAEYANNIFWKSKRYQLLVPYFSLCYRRINPGKGKKFIVLRDGRRLRRDVQVENVVTMLLLKRFRDYNEMWKLKKYELFLACWQALDKNSEYYKEWGTDYWNERLPEVYTNYISNRDKKFLDEISFNKYAQYITKPFFMDRLLMVFSNVEKALMRHRTPGDNFDKYLEFFINGTANFFKSLRYKATFLDKMDEDKQKSYKKLGAFSVIMETLDELLVGDIYEITGEHANVKVAWQALYDYDPQKINDRMLGVENTSLSYGIVEE